MKIKRYDVVPAILFVYLCVMVWLGYPDYVAGATPAWFYFGGTAFTILVIVLLRINLKKRAEYRKRRLEDIKKTDEKKAAASKSEDHGNPDDSKS